MRRESIRRRAQLEQQWQDSLLNTKFAVGDLCVLNASGAQDIWFKKVDKFAGSAEELVGLKAKVVDICHYHPFGAGPYGMDLLKIRLYNRGGSKWFARGRPFEIPVKYADVLPACGDNRLTIGRFTVIPYGKM